MAYRELMMIDVKELLRRWAAGHSLRNIALEAGIDRGTVSRYATIATEIGLSREREPTDDEVHEVAQRVQARPLPDASEQWKELTVHKKRIEEWLSQKRPLRLSKVHTLLAREHGVTGSYDTLRRFAMSELDWHKREPTIRLDDPPPAQEAQVDFGKMGPMFDAGTSTERGLWVLIVTLSFSRYQFVWPTFVQTIEAVCEGLDRAWAFFNGMTKTIIPDNMKSIVKTPDPLAPTLVDGFIEYTQARGIFVDPARVRSPKDKPRVENQVAYVRESWFDGESFTSLEDARDRATIWCRDVAGMRVHGTTRAVPRDKFLSDEAPLMLPAPTTPFDVPVWVEAAKVHPDHHIQVARALYSVPSIHRNKTVRARADRALVKIYLGTELIKVHPRQLPGGRSTDVDDYPKGKAAYALRSVDALIAKANEKGHHIGIYAKKLLDGPLPWARMRAVYALLRLCDKFGDGRVEAICQSALAFDVIEIKRITRMLKMATQITPPENDDRKVVQLSIPRFARPEEHFETRVPTKKEGA